MISSISGTYVSLGSWLDTAMNTGYHWISSIMTIFFQFLPIIIIIWVILFLITWLLWLVNGGFSFGSKQKTKWNFTTSIKN